MDHDARRLVGGDDGRSWEVVGPGSCVAGLFSGHLPENPICEFCTHLDGAVTTELAGYYLVAGFGVVDFYPAGADEPLPLARMIAYLRRAVGDVPLEYLARRYWHAPSRFFACSGHTALIEADPRFTDPPPRPTDGQLCGTGVIDAFFACRRTGLMPVPTSAIRPRYRSVERA